MKVVDGCNMRAASNPKPEPRIFWTETLEAGHSRIQKNQNKPCSAGRTGQSGGLRLAHGLPVDDQCRIMLFFFSVFIHSCVLSVGRDREEEVRDVFAK